MIDILHNTSVSFYINLYLLLKNKYFIRIYHVLNWILKLI